MDATNVQEYQRLNEAISACLDTVRRLVPQLGQVQQSVAQLSLPFHGHTMAAGGFAAPWTGIDPITAAMVQREVQARTYPIAPAPWAFGPSVPFIYGPQAVYPPHATPFGFAPQTPFAQPPGAPFGFGGFPYASAHQGPFAGRV